MTRAVILVAVFALVACNSRRNSERELAAALERQQAYENAAKAQATAGAVKQEESIPVSELPDKLARLIRDPDSTKPMRIKPDGKLERRRYDITPFAQAELAHVKDHPEAWSWMLVNPKSDFAVKDLGPAGAVRDLLGGAPPIGGFSIGGVIH